jgi:hypothetical protein
MMADETPMMYSSTDLLNWKNLGKQASSVTGLWRPKIAKPNGSFWVRRPQSIYCQGLVLTRVIVQLYGQQDRYVLSLKSTQMVGGLVATWYLLTSADHNTVQINKINSDGTVGARASTLSTCQLHPEIRVILDSS